MGTWLIICFVSCISYWFTKYVRGLSDKLQTTGQIMFSVPLCNPLQNHHHTSTQRIFFVLNQLTCSHFWMLQMFIVRQDKLFYSFPQSVAYHNPEWAKKKREISVAFCILIFCCFPYSDILC